MVSSVCAFVFPKAPLCADLREAYNKQSLFKLGIFSVLVALMNFHLSYDEKQTFFLRLK